MDLILWRHAEALDERPDLADLDRPLTPKGERQAARMAEWLNQRLAPSTRILVSPALRCQQTAAFLAKRFQTLGALAPGGSARALFSAAGWPDAAEPVLVVGHQPTLGFAASTLVADQSQPWALKKGAVVWLRQRQRRGGTDAEGADAMEVVLHAVQSPDLL